MHDLLDVFRAPRGRNASTSAVVRRAIPLHAVEAVVASSSEPTASRVTRIDGALKRLLIANDDLDLHSGLARALVSKLRGCAVESTSSFAAAVDSVRHRAPDAVIIEHCGRTRSCADIVRKLRALPGGHALVIFVLTTEDGMATEEGLRAAGADRCFLDTTSVPDLVDRLILASLRPRPAPRIALVR